MTDKINNEWENKIWQWATNEFPRQHSDKFEKLLEVVRSLLSSERQRLKETLKLWRPYFYRDKITDDDIKELDKLLEE